MEIQWTKGPVGCHPIGLFPVETLEGMIPPGEGPLKSPFQIQKIKE